MSTKRTLILQALIDDLVSAGVVEERNITRRLAYLHEVNDFPAISFSSATERRSHYGDGRKLAQLDLQLRGYVHGEDSVTLAETLARAIEDAVDTYARAHPDLDLYEARVFSLRTDEGLYAPHGIADLNIEITYEV